MNKFKLMIIALLISSTGAMFAVNKQQIRLSNNYGEAVLVHMEWRMKKAPHFRRTQDIILKGKRKNFLLKAPVSGYYLESLTARPSKATIIASTVVPAAAIAGAAIGVATGGAAPVVAGSGMTAAQNATFGGVIGAEIGSEVAIDATVISLQDKLFDSYKVHAHGNNFFVIENRKTKYTTIKSIQGKKDTTKKRTVQEMHIKGYKSQQEYFNALEKLNTPAIDEPAVKVVNNNTTQDYQDVTATDDQPNIEETLVLESQDDQVDNEDAVS